MKPAILHLRASNFVGGPEKQILAYASYCSDELNTIIASFCGPAEGTDLLREAASRGITTLALPAHSLTQSARSVVNCARQSQVRLLCAHGYKAALVASIASKITGIPYACFLRGSTKENLKVAIYEAVESFCCRLADRIVCLSETQAARFNRYKDRVRVVVNAAEVRNYSPEERRAAKQRICDLAGLDPERPLAVAAGRLSPEKGAAIFIDAANLLSKAQSNLQYAIFGEGVERERLIQRIRKLCLDSNFKLVGHHPNFAELVCGADLLVNPSLTEEMPNVVLEAMSAGVPIVATAVGGVPELGRDGAIALVNPGDANQLAESIETVLSHPSARSFMIGKSQARLEHDFSRAHQSEQLRALYSEFVLLPRSDRDSQLPRISVVIPARNEEQGLPAVLAALHEQEYPSELFEIIVADGMSTDGTSEAVAESARQPGAPIRVVQNSKQLSSAGRNVGAAAAHGDIIFFCDAHCYVPSRTMLRDVAHLFATTDADILCRPQPLDFPGSSAFQKTVAAARASWLGHGRDSTIYSTEFEGWANPSSAGAIYRRRLFERFGGFDENFDACEDVEFNYRLHCGGVSAYISPKLTIFYEPRKTLVSLFQQMQRYGKGRVRLGRKHPRSSSVSQWIPALLVLLIISGAPLLFTSVFHIWLLIIAIYLGIVGAESARIAVRAGLAKLGVLPAVFLAIHTGLGTGLLVEAAFGKRRRSSAVPKLFSDMNGEDHNVQLATPSSRTQEIGIG